MRPRLAAALLLALALAACQGAPTEPPRPASQAKGDAAARAREAMARRDWNMAAPLLREAVAARPADVSLHYDLAVAASYLDLRDEAIREFRWVVANAQPDSQEYKAAKSWLAEAEGTGGTRSTAAPPARPADKSTTLHVERVGDAGLYGRVTWSSEPGGPQSTKRMQIHLTGLPGTSAKEQRYTVRTDDEGRYEFKRIVAGPYKLSDRVAGQPVWRLKVQVEAGRETAVDLQPGNSVTLRDDFPDEGR
ncbi:MAG: hypothetical protein HYU51_08815 [Candidatus Rokubacteria bacterium]|nr:hypothetical protein [Candidatus Rokubacteria bacterium]